MTKTLEKLITDHLKTGVSNITIMWMKNKDGFYAMSSNYRNKDHRSSYGKTVTEAVSGLNNVIDEMDDILS